MITKEVIQKRLANVLEKTDFKGLGERRQGKVRDIYTQPDRIILVATDRYSAFDRNLALIPFKGQVLVGISRFWFEQTADILPNHVLSYPDPNVVVAKKCEVIPIEIVVRGYITGVTSTAIWTKYQAGEREFGGVTLPEGMKKNQKLERPLLTPTTKSDQHDEPITPAEIISRRIVSAERWAEIERAAFALFARGQELAAARGLILVDTKYEMGIVPDGTLTLIDEIHTPDSSRYWQKATYEERLARGEEPENFDKEFLRLWFKEHCDPYKDATLPPAPEEMVVELASRYIKIYEQLTGQAFDPGPEEDIAGRIKRNLASLRAG